MTKRTITRLWLWGLAGIVVGLIIAGAGVAMMLTGAGTWSGPADHPVFTPTYGAYFTTTVVIIVAGGLVLVGGSIAQFVAWIGALINTSRATDKTWFILLLVLGLLSAQFVMMIVYLLAGPDVPAPWRYTMPLPPAAPPPAAGIRAA